MGGKHKQAQRTKNNTKPSSSGRTAELLSASTSFTGFSKAKDVAAQGLSLGYLFNTSVIDKEKSIDVNFQIVLKKMVKKDSITKFKALQEFTQMINSHDPEVVKSILIVWPRLYANLAVDTDHKVREATHIAHRAISLKVKKDLAPYLKQLSGPWFTSQYDTYAPAASAAIQSFQDSFPNKTSEVIIFCQSEILSFIHDNIVQSPQVLINQNNMSPEDAEAKYERLLISSLQGYIFYLNKLSFEELQAVKILNKRIISNPKFWKLPKSKVPLIRASWFGCICVLFQKTPFLLVDEDQRVITTVFNNLDENEPCTVSATWDAILFVVSNIKEWWNYVNFEKLVFPKLWKVLKEAGQGSAVVVYPNMLPLISHLPSILDYDTFYNYFFTNMRIGMKKRTIAQSRLELNTIAISFTECLRYIIMKNISNLDLCHSLIVSHLILLIEWTFLADNVISKTLYSEISALLQYWEKSKSTSEFANYNILLSILWEQLENLLKNSLSRSKNDSILIMNKHIELLLSLKRRSASKQKKQKVKFALTDSKIENIDSLSDISKSSDKNPIINNLNILVHNICAFYLTFIKEKKLSGLIPPICLLMQNFENAELFKHISNNMGSEITNEIDLLNNVFIKFLKRKWSCLETVVDIFFTIYKYLTNEGKLKVLNNLMQLENEDCLCWCVAKALSHPFCNDPVIQKWLTTSPVTQLLINITSYMLLEEVSTDKKLLLKQALSQNINGELYISRQACEDIMIMFCNCLQSPDKHLSTIDVCASFAAQLASTLYTEQTLLIYGDQLILALFSLSCNTKVDSDYIDYISPDTLWEVGTAWQDVLTLLITANLTTELENILFKLRNILENEFLINNSSFVRLISVSVDLITCLLQNNNEDYTFISRIILYLPDSLKICYKFLTDMCNNAKIIRGDVSWIDECPISTNIFENNFENENIIKYLKWNQFVINVLMLLYSTKKNDQDETDNKKQDIEYIFEENSDDINNLIVNALNSFSKTKIFLNNYNSLKIHKDLLQLYICIKTDYSMFLNDIITKNMLNSIVKIIEMNNYDTAYIINEELIRESVEKTLLYTRLLNSNLESNVLLHLTQIFSKYITFDHIKDQEDTEKIITTRVLLHCEDIDVQISEVLVSFMSMREQNIESLLYNCDVSSCNWKDLQKVIEIIRFLEALIDQKPLFFSSQHWDFILISFSSWASSVNKSKHNYKKLQITEFICAIFGLHQAFVNFIKNKDLITQLNHSCTNLVTEFNDIFSHNIHVFLINTWLYIATKELNATTTYDYLIPALEIIGSTVSYFENKYFIQENDEQLPKWQTILQICNKLLTSSVYVLKICGYEGLKKSISSLLLLDAQLPIKDKNQSEGILKSQFTNFLNHIQDIVLALLMDFKLGEDTCLVEPFTDSFSYCLAYILIWDALFVNCHLIESDSPDCYLDWLSSENYFKILMQNIFKLMPANVLHCSAPKNLFIEGPALTFKANPTSELLEHAVCWIYMKVLTYFPLVIRQWWTEVDAKFSQCIDKVTTNYVSPILCAQEMEDVVEKRDNNNEIKVKIYSSTREVIAATTIDDVRVELIITMPVNYPLGAFHVECSKKIVENNQYRNWIMQLSVFLNNQNGRIYDVLLLWKNNLEKKIAASEECNICFAALHHSSYRLPKASCRTCRKKFHSICLTKWFNSSTKFTCPLCRSQF